jgi:bifunctional DNA-binding transcriptional regulator/antitoxin component of YhaV-PrlF toxin-antitoxin module
MLNTLTQVKQISKVKHMEKDSLKLSNKFQLVIPASARKTLGLQTAKNQNFVVKSVNKNEITFKKEPTLDDFLGAYTGYFPKDATKAIRKMRDNDWE